MCVTEVNLYTAKMKTTISKPFAVLSYCVSRRAFVFFFSGISDAVKLRMADRITVNVSTHLGTETATAELRISWRTPKFRAGPSRWDRRRALPSAASEHVPHGLWPTISAASDETTAFSALSQYLKLLFSGKSRNRFTKQIWIRETVSVVAGAPWPKRVCPVGD